MDRMSIHTLPLVWQRTTNCCPWRLFGRADSAIVVVRMHAAVATPCALVFVIFFQMLDREVDQETSRHANSSKTTVQCCLVALSSTFSFLNSIRFVFV